MSDAPGTLINAETILIAEDNDDHVMLIKRAFMQARFLNPVQVVGDGVEAIAYLNGDGKYADRKTYPIPALLLLDLKMPNKDGFEVLEWPPTDASQFADRCSHHIRPYFRCPTRL